MKSIGKKYFIFLIVILLIQVFLIFFWGNKRENFYWDEYYTFEKAHYISSSTGEEHFIIDDQEYKENEWMPISFVKNSLVVVKDNSIINDSVIYFFKRLLGYNNYAVYLNIAETFFSPGKLSIWPAIILNVVFFLCIQVILFFMTYLICKSEIISLLTVAFYGFSSMSLSMAIFVRFYVLATLFTTLFVYFHLKYWISDSKKPLKRCLFLVLSFACLYLGYCNAQYVIIFGAFFILTFSIMILIVRKWIQFLLYAVPVYGCGLYYLATQTNYLGILFDFETTYNNTNGAMQWVMEQIMCFTPEVLPVRIDEMLKLIGRYLFGSYFVMLFLFALVIILGVIGITKKDAKEIPNLSTQFAWSLTGALLLFMLFFTIFGLYDQPRYISYVFPMLALVNVSFFHNQFSNKQICTTIMILVVIIQIALVNVKSKVDMLYVGDGQNIQTIMDLKADSVMLYVRSRSASSHIVYQSTLFVDDDAEFFSYNSKDLNVAKDALRDGMLLVFSHGTQHDEFDDMIINNGFCIRDVGDTYNFSIKQIRKE